MSAFNKETYDVAFKKSIAKLKTSEKTTREQLMALSRSVLEALHVTQDIAYVNKTLAVLSPMNKKTAVLYFKAFTGFNYDVATLAFTNKNKKAYEAIKALADTFLEDPHNNIWTWADQNLELEPKKFDTDAIKAAMGVILKKAEKNGISQADVMKAILSAGVTVDTVIEVMESMGDVVQVPAKTY